MPLYWSHDELTTWYIYIYYPHLSRIILLFIYIRLKLHLAFKHDFVTWYEMIDEYHMFYTLVRSHGGNEMWNYIYLSIAIVHKVFLIFGNHDSMTWLLHKWFPLFVLLRDVMIDWIMNSPIRKREVTMIGSKWVSLLILRHHGSPYKWTHRRPMLRWVRFHFISKCVTYP